MFVWLMDGELIRTNSKFLQKTALKSRSQESMKTELTQHLSLNDTVTEKYLLPIETFVLHETQLALFAFPCNSYTFLHPASEWIQSETTLNNTLLP
jgi:hypothetical protein